VLKTDTLNLSVVLVEIRPGLGQQMVKGTDLGAENERSSRFD
jgi:hypothetical protein